MFTSVACSICFAKMMAPDQTTGKRVRCPKCGGLMGSRSTTKKKVEGADVLSALWALARPRLLPFVLLLPLVGFGWGHWDHALCLRGLPALGWVLAAWAVLQTGTLWLNAALDRDQGEVLLGCPVPTPLGASAYGYAALALAAVLAYGGGLLAGSACTLCAVLSILYSHPAAAWKGRPLLGPLVNVVGYGLLSPLAGWSAVGTTAMPRTLVVWLLAALGVLGCYFAAQAFQADEDRTRGYRTLVVTHGPAAALLAARGCIGSGFLGGGTLAGLGWLPRVCLIALPLGWWVDRWLRRWSAQPNGGGERWARGFARRMILAATLAVAAAYADYLVAAWAGQPVAGMATAAARPAD
jgi:DNA-directed RNA polymerase subunit RPC12/RpoP